MATNRKRKNLWIFILIGAVLLLSVFAILKNKNKSHGEEVETEKAEKRTIQEEVSASGRIFPVTEVKISSDVSGEVVELYVEEGDSVRQGQLLARIDPDAYQSQVERGQAGVNASRAQAATSRAQIENLKAQKEQIGAQLENAREVHRRNEQLRKDGVVSQADFETSQTSLRSLEANMRSVEASIRSAEQSAKAADFTVQSAEATLKELRTSLRRTDIFAPMTGVVSRLNIEKGERVVGTIQMAGTELMRVADLSKMEVQVDMSENDIPRVKIGDEVDIEVDAFINKKFKGKVTEIAHSASNMPASVGGVTASLTSDQVTNFIVTIDIDPASYADLVTREKPFPFRPGMSASVDVKTNTIADALSIPIQAVTTRDKDADKKKAKPADEKAETTSDASGKEEKKADDIIEVVYVVKGDTVAQREVTTGIQDDTYIQVLSGIEDGYEVVTGPYAAVSRKLKSGAKVTHKKLDDKKKKKD